MSQRKLQKEVESIFKKIHEGIDLFNYYYTRHQSSSNDSQKEKLESDLKKEIKKLQKYREQIKAWQSNDSMEAAIHPAKLQEHRKMVEEAMECYKDVEKNSKMKSFSNQSIMLAAMKSMTALTPRAEDAVRFLESSIEELETQNSDLEMEYDKLSQKKTRKSASTAIEERKQEFESFINRNKFHIEKLKLLIEFIKRGRISPDSIEPVEDHISFYLEANQEPDFIDDESLYDEIMKEASDSASKANTMKLEDESTMEESFYNLSKDFDSELEDNTSKDVTSPIKQHISDDSNNDLPETPIKDSASRVAVESANEQVSPAILRNLKPATAPSNPLGGMKWAVAAAGVKNSKATVSSPILPLNTMQGEISPESENTPMDSKLDKIQQDEEHGNSNIYSRFLDVLRSSDLSENELDLFTDTNLIKLPPGIQDLVISYKAFEEDPLSDPKLLIKSKLYNAFSTPLRRPFLSVQIQASFNHYLSGSNKDQKIHLPLHMLKFQGIWNRIRSSDQFAPFLKRYQLLSQQRSSENAQILKELSMVLFYGYYLGEVPLENLMAEACLFELNWRPFHSDTNLSNVESLPGKQIIGTQKYTTTSYYWIKCINLIHSPQQDGTDLVEYGDYEIFDLLAWDIHVKSGFRLEHKFCQMEPSKSLF